MLVRTIILLGAPLCGWGGHDSLGQSRRTCMTFAEERFMPLQHKGKRKKATIVIMMMALCNFNAKTESIRHSSERTTGLLEVKHMCAHLISNEWCTYGRSEMQTLFVAAIVEKRHPLFRNEWSGQVRNNTWRYIKQYWLTFVEKSCRPNCIYLPPPHTHAPRTAPGLKAVPVSSGGSLPRPQNGGVGGPGGSGGSPHTGPADMTSSVRVCRVSMHVVLGEYQEERICMCIVVCTMKSPDNVLRFCWKQWEFQEETSEMKIIRLYLQDDTVKRSLSRWDFASQHFDMRLSRWDFQDKPFKMSLSRWEFRADTFKMRLPRWDFQDETFKLRLSRGEFRDDTFKMELERWDFQDETFKMRLSRWDCQDKTGKMRLSRWDLQDGTFKILVLCIHVIYTDVYMICIYIKQNPPTSSRSRAC